MRGKKRSGLRKVRVLANFGEWVSSYFDRLLAIKKLQTDLAAAAENRASY